MRSHGGFGGSGAAGVLTLSEVGVFLFSLSMVVTASFLYSKHEGYHGVIMGTRKKQLEDILNVMQQLDLTEDELIKINHDKAANL
jgi:hypothetical protein